MPNVDCKYFSKSTLCFGHPFNYSLKKMREEAGEKCSDQTPRTTFISSSIFACAIAAWEYLGHGVSENEMNAS